MCMCYDKMVRMHFSKDYNNIIMNMDFDVKIYTNNMNENVQTRDIIVITYFKHRKLFCHQKYAVLKKHQSEEVCPSQSFFFLHFWQFLYKIWCFQLALQTLVMYIPSWEKNGPAIFGHCESQSVTD